MPTDKSLKDKAIKIQGKNYVLVADRVLYFNENYPTGFIKTNLLSTPDAEEVVVQATVCPAEEKPNRVFTGLSQAVKGEGYINKTSALENCETSAVGRALAMMGIGVIESIASADEINKARNTSSYQATPSRFPVRNATRVVKNDEAWKVKIKEACDSFDPLLTSKEDYETFVFNKTGLKLLEENANDILATLKSLNK
jgi:hypothetical protein